MGNCSCQPCDNVKEFQSESGYQEVKLEKTVQKSARDFPSNASQISMPNQHSFHLPLQSGKARLPNQQSLCLSSQKQIESSIISSPMARVDSNVTARTCANYEGDMHGTKRHGRGIQRWSDKSYYDGEWHNDMAQGKGFFRYSDGSMFYGQWQCNKANGDGIYVDTQGTQWVGSWSDDYLNGIGLEICYDHTYQGMFHDGIKEGYGRCVWSDGAEFRGTWYEDAIEGFGQYTWADGKVYIGDWVRNVMQGKGNLKVANHYDYHGDFLNDKKHGYGIEQLGQNESLFGSSAIEGTWLNGRLEGLAICKAEISELWQYKNGERIKHFEVCHLQSIIPTDWVHPQKYLSDRLRLVERELAQQSVQKYQQIYQFEYDLVKSRLHT